MLSARVERCRADRRRHGGDHRRCTTDARSKRADRHARRFRRQCQPRAAHAARDADRLHRDAARAGARRRRGARAVPRDHARAGATAWRGWWPTCCRCRASSSTSTAPPTGQVDLGGCSSASPTRSSSRRPSEQMTMRHRAPPPDGRRRPARRPAGDQGDATSSTQVFQNLIDNAIKYGRPGTPIRVAGWIASRERRPAPDTARAQRLDRPAGGRRDRPGRRHRARASAAADRAVLPGRRRRARAISAAPGSALPSSSTSSTAIAAGSRSTASSARAASSRSSCRLPEPTVTVAGGLHPNYSLRYYQ